MKDIDSQCLELSEILKANFLTSQKRKLWPNKVKIMSRGYPLVNVFYAVNSFSVMTMQTLTCFYPFPLFFCFFIPSFSCQRSTSSISKMKQVFSKTVFKESCCFLNRCFHVFFFMCNFFCKNLWFFFQGLMKNFNSCMKQSCSFSQDVLGWSEMTVSSEEMEGILMTTPTPSASVTLGLSLPLLQGQNGDDWVHVKISVWKVRAK